MENVLPYVHPLWQGAGLFCVLVALRWGLSIRRARLRLGSEPRGPARARHVRAAILAVSIIVSGQPVGVVSMAFFRHEPAFSSVHAYAGSASVGLFLIGGIYGWRLRQGGPHREDARQLHVFCVGLALLGALVAGIAGYRLLP